MFKNLADSSLISKVIVFRLFERANIVRVRNSIARKIYKESSSFHHYKNNVLQVHFYFLGEIGEVGEMVFMDILPLELSDGLPKRF